MTYTLENSQLVLTFADRGAELISVVKKATNREYLWQGDEAIWPDQSPVLFPVIGRLQNDMLVHQGKSYPLEKHGFAKFQIFSVAEQTDHSITFLLTPNPTTKQSYPFDYQLYITYLLEDDRITFQYQVKNTDEETIYFSIGGHPGFYCSLKDHICFNQKETTQIQHINGDGYIYEKIPFLEDSNIVPLHEHTFDNGVLIFEELNSTQVTLTAEDNSYQVTVDFSQAPIFGIWAKPKAEYVCFEPWCGIDEWVDDTHDFQHKKQIVTLETAQTFQFQFGVTIG